MNKRGYNPPQLFACGPGIPAIIGGVLVVSEAVVGVSAAASRILKAVEVAISVHRGVNAIAEHAKNVGVGSNSNDSDSINNSSKTTTLINPEKPATFEKKKINGESGSKKTETKDNKGTGTGGGSNKEPDDGNQ